MKHSLRLTNKYGYGYGVDIHNGSSSSSVGPLMNSSIASPSNGSLPASPSVASSSSEAGVASLPESNSSSSKKNKTEKRKGSLPHGQSNSKISKPIPSEHKVRVSTSPVTGSALKEANVTGTLAIATLEGPTANSNIRLDFDDNAYLRDILNDNKPDNTAIVATSSNSLSTFNPPYTSNVTAINRIPDNSDDGRIGHWTDGTIRSSDPWICCYCGMEFPDNEILKKHAPTHAKYVPNKCYVCGKKFCGGGAISNHIDLVHRKLRNWMCDLCPKRYYANCDLERHKNQVHLKTPYVCTICSYLCHNDNTLREHYIGRHQAKIKFKVPYLPEIAKVTLMTAEELQQRLSSSHAQKEQGSGSSQRQLTTAPLPLPLTQHPYDKMSTSQPKADQTQPKSSLQSKSSSQSGNAVIQAPPLPSSLPTGGRRALIGHFSLPGDLLSRKDSPKADNGKSPSAKAGSPRHPSTQQQSQQQLMQQSQLRVSSQQEQSQKQQPKQLPSRPQSSKHGNMLHYSSMTQPSHGCQSKPMYPSRIKNDPADWTHLMGKNVPTSSKNIDGSKESCSGSNSGIRPLICGPTSSSSVLNPVPKNPGTINGLQSIAAHPVSSSTSYSSNHAMPNAGTIKTEYVPNLLNLALNPPLSHGQNLFQVAGKMAAGLFHFPPSSQLQTLPPALPLAFTTTQASLMPPALHPTLPHAMPTTLPLTFEVRSHSDSLRLHFMSQDQLRNDVKTMAHPNAYPTPAMCTHLQGSLFPAHSLPLSTIPTTHPQVKAEPHPFATLSSSSHFTTPTHSVTRPLTSTLPFQPATAARLPISPPPALLSRPPAPLPRPPAPLYTLPAPIPGPPALLLGPPAPLLAPPPLSLRPPPPLRTKSGVIHQPKKIEPGHLPPTIPAQVTSSPSYQHPQNHHPQFSSSSSSQQFIHPPPLPPPSASQGMYSHNYIAPSQPYAPLSSRGLMGNAFDSGTKLVNASYANLAAPPRPPASTAPSIPCIKPEPIDTGYEVNSVIHPRNPGLRTDVGLQNTVAAASSSNNSFATALGVQAQHQPPSQSLPSQQPIHGQLPNGYVQCLDNVTVKQELEKSYDFIKLVLYDCMHCGQRYGHRGIIEFHLDKKHCSKNKDYHVTFMCKLCDKPFLCELDLDIHLTGNH